MRKLSWGSLKLEGKRVLAFVLEFMTHLGGQTDGPLLDPATVLKPPNKRIPIWARVLTLPSPIYSAVWFRVNAVSGFAQSHGRTSGSGFLHV